MTSERNGGAARDNADRRRLAPNVVEEARRLYEVVGLPDAEIGRRVGANDRTIARRAERAGWRRADREQGAVAGRLRSRIEQEIAAANAAAEDAKATGSPEAERAARTLASLVKTLRELATYDDEQARRACEAARIREEDAARGDSADFADLDAFREELAARIDRLRGERAG